MMSPFLNWLIQLLPLALLWVGGGFLLGLALAYMAWAHLRGDREANLFHGQELARRREGLEQEILGLEAKVIEMDRSADQGGKAKT